MIQQITLIQQIAMASAEERLQRLPVRPRRLAAERGATGYKSPRFDHFGGEGSGLGQGRGPLCCGLGERWLDS